MDNIYINFKKLSLRKQVIIGTLGLFFTLALLTISIVIINTALLTSLSYYYLSNSLETLEDSELRTILRLVDVETYSTTENSRFGVQWIRNYYENLLSNNEFFNQFSKIEEKSEKFFVYVDSKNPTNCNIAAIEEPIKLKSSFESNDSDDFQTHLKERASEVKSNIGVNTENKNDMSLYTSPIILLSSIKSLDFLSNLKDNLQITSTNKQYNPIYCMGFQVFDNKKPIEDQIKTKNIFTVVYPLIETLYNTDNRFFGKKKFHNLFFSFKDFNIHYPYTKNIDSRYSEQVNKQTFSSVTKYLAYNFKQHLIYKDNNFIDKKNILKYYDKNPMISYAKSIEVMRPYKFNIESLAFVSTISAKFKNTKLENSDVTLDDLFQNPLQYIDNLFFSDLDSLVYDTITNSFASRFKGFSSQAFEEKNLGILLYRNCLKTIRTWENFIGNTTYTDGLITNSIGSDKFDLNFPLVLQHCFKDNTTRERILDLTSNSSKIFTRKAKIPFLKDNLKVMKADTPGIYSKMYYNSEYVTNYSVLFLLSKVDAYLEKDKQFFREKFANMAIFFITFTVIIWGLGFIIVLINSIKVANNLSNSVKALVEEISRAARKGTGITKETESNLELISFPYDDDIDEFFSNCKSVIKGSIAKSDSNNLKNKSNILDLRNNLIKEVENYRDKLDVNYHDEEVENKENTKQSNFDSEIIEENLNEIDEENDSLVKVKRSNLMFNDTFVDYFDERKKNANTTYYNNEIEKNVFEFEKKDIIKTNKENSDNKFHLKRTISDFYNNSFKSLVSYKKRSFENNEIFDTRLLDRKLTDEKPVENKKTKSKIFNRISVEENDIYLEENTGELLQSAINYHKEKFENNLGSELYEIVNRLQIKDNNK